MHIVYIIAPGGGPEAYTKTFSPWLLAQGHSVSLICVCDPNRQQLSYPEGVIVHYVNPTGFHYYLAKIVGGFRSWPRRLRALETGWAVHKTIRQINRKSPIDLIEVTEGFPIRRLTKHWPVVVRAHGSDWVFRQQCQDGDRKGDVFLIRAAARQFRQATRVSPLSKDYALTLSHAVKVPLEVFEPMPYPIDTAFFSPEGETVKFNDLPVLMSIGRLEHRKGTDILLKAMNQVWDAFPDARLVLLGKLAGFTYDELLSLIPTNKHDHLVLPGFIEHSKIPAYLRAVDLYLAPTQYETLGYTILEAMACGKAVISCTVGAVPELITHQVNGWLVPFGDHGQLAAAIIKLLKDRALRKDLETAAREKAEQYRMSVICPQIETFYTTAISNHNR
jgi:glycosyltransferase involved in cell wall biosynthesis